MNSNPKIQAIFFDLDDTLCATSEFTAQARFDAVKAMVKMGLKMEPSELFSELLDVIDEFSSNYSQHFDKLLLRLPPQKQEGLNKAMLVAAAVIAYHDAKQMYLKPYSDVLLFLQDLAPFPILKGIITDGLAVKQAEKLIRLGLVEYFDSRAIFISEQIGFSKLNTKIYLHVCQSLHLCAEKTMYVGDHPQRDIDAANKAGLITVRIRREGKYKNLEGKTPARHEIQNLAELRPILETTYGLQ